ncbi:MAG: anti-sigma factor antagonist [Clostridia bacterium]|nr:anti-sigma factor antagonist [Clostridia bacterium]
MVMEYSFKQKPEGLLCCLRGDLDLHGCDSLRSDLVCKLKTTHIRNLIFDFSQLDFIDSSGLGVILARHRELAAIGGKVEIRGAKDNVYNLLQLSGITRIIEVNKAEGA